MSKLIRVSRRTYDTINKKYIWSPYYTTKEDLENADYEWEEWSGYYPGDDTDERYEKMKRELADEVNELLKQPKYEHYKDKELTDYIDKIASVCTTKDT